MTAPVGPEVGVYFRPYGMEGVGRSLRLVRDEAEPTARKWGAASRQMAGGLEAIARQGKVTGESLKAIATQGAEMAFMFGAAGPIVGAIAITGIAIYEHITGNIKKARDEARQFQTEIQGLRRAGNLTGAGELSQRLFSGDRFSVQGENESAREFEARQLGVLGIRGKIAGLRGTVAGGVDPRTGEMLESAVKAQQLIKEWGPILEQYERRASAAARAVDELATAEGKRVAAGARVALADFERMGFKGRPGPYNPYIIGAEGGPTRFLDEIFAGRQRSPMDFAIKTRAPNLMGTASPATQSMVDGMKAAAELAGRGFVDTLASTIEAGVSRIFQKGATIGNVFAAIGQTALSGLGSVAVQIGRSALTHFKFVEKIGMAIAKWNPALGAAAAIGLIAFGSGLIGAGSRMGANAAGGGGGASYGAYGAAGGFGSTVIDRGVIDPTRNASGVSPRQSITNHIVVIGPNDPIAQRQLQELLRNGSMRGTL